jgi:gephyrin
MLPVTDALEIVLAHAEPLPAETISIHDALGMVLAEDAVASTPLPPFPASVKDGYAVVADDGPGVYPVVGEVTAGRVADFWVKPGSVAYITTGAPLPPGADAVIQIEDTEPLLSEGGQARVRILAQARFGQDVRPVGMDVAAGTTVLAAGDLLGPAEIGLLATTGITNAPVFRRPRVAILSTGDELREPGDTLDLGQIWDSNRATLGAAVRQAGGVPIDLGISGDTQAALETNVRRGLAEADILLTSGGVSMGELDLIKPLLEEAGTIHFGRMRMKPGKPLTFATVPVQEDGRERTRLVFGLPGNPVSSLVTFYLMGVPALRKLAGYPNPRLQRVQAHLAQSLRLDPERPEYHRAALHWDGGLNGGDGGYLAVSTGSQASSRLLSMRTANALLELPQAEGELAAGAVVWALLIG